MWGLLDIVGNFNNGDELDPDGGLDYHREQIWAHRRGVTVEISCFALKLVVRIAALAGGAALVAAGVAVGGVMALPIVLPIAAMGLMVFLSTTTLAGCENTMLENLENAKDHAISATEHSEAAKRLGQQTEGGGLAGAGASQPEPGCSRVESNQAAAGETPRKAAIGEIARMGKESGNEDARRAASSIAAAASEIDALLERYPERDGRQARMLFGCLLPTAAELLRKDAELRGRATETEALKQARSDIAETLRAIERACAKQIEVLHQADAIDAEVERKTMMAVLAMQ